MLNTKVIESFDAVVCVVFVGNGVKRAEYQLLKALQELNASVSVSIRNSLSRQPQKISVEFWRQSKFASGAIRHDVAQKQHQSGSFDVTH